MATIKAVAYTRDVVLAQTGAVVRSGIQMEQIKGYASENGIEIVAWFTDDAAEVDLLKRPGIQALLEYNQPYSLLLCERVWVLSRSMAPLEPFFQELDRHGVRLESLAPMWDCVSQQARRRSKSMPILPPQSGIPRDVQTQAPYRVARPARLNFVNLIHQDRAISTRL